MCVAIYLSILQQKTKLLHKNGIFATDYTCWYTFVRFVAIDQCIATKKTTLPQIWVDPI